ncbi:hypothetical protein QQS21_006865 [Conoideocrella luteorostrata]|uniref:Uncharacterized protein n=1 Tax=Conoideocrella luteorostrata TaxID=1105319 RepID=A0AAJ0FXW0_9HYPO|nr:hypothetical protein QQS21_006865 [Conoideocrella luteorostrata]
MPGSMMIVLTGAVALLGAFTTGGLAQSASNAQSTETLQPQTVGTATSNGAFLVSVNYCTVVMNTQCMVSVMTSAASPASASSAAPVETTNPAIESATIPTLFSIPTSAAAPSTEASMPSETQPPSSYGTEMTQPAPTASSPTGAPATTTPLTAAAAGIKAFPPAAWGAAILAVAVLI